MKTRKANNEDENAIKSLIRETLSEHGIHFTEGVTDKHLDNIEEHFKEPSILIVLENERKIIGCAGALHKKEDNFEFVKIYLSKEFRKKGLGNTLLEHLISHAKKSKARKITLYSNSLLEPAIKLFRKNNFEIVTLEDSKYPVGCNIYMENITP